MHSYKKIIIIFSVAALVFTGIAATKAPEPEKPKNLKILPKDISHEDLEKVMHGFNDALGVHCDFCHAKSKDPNQRWPDFASDEKPEKNIARKMMKMTAKINKKYFSFEKDEQGNMKNVVSCGICHHGTPHPEFKAPPHEEHQPPPPPPPANN
ncbi:MAG TPA: c-type cytochrome [Puia sp.]|nr:c-type cytochrome [Puia sp.]